MRTTTGAWAITLVNKGDRRRSRLDAFGDACIHSAAHSCNIAIKYRNMSVCAFVGMVCVGAVRHGRRFFFVRIRLTSTLDVRFVRKLSPLGSNFMCFRAVPWSGIAGQDRSPVLKRFHCSFPHAEADVAKRSNIVIIIIILIMYYEFDY